VQVLRGPADMTQLTRLQATARSPPSKVCIKGHPHYIHSQHNQNSHPFDEPCLKETLTGRGGAVPGPRRVPQGPSQTPNARSDLRKRAVSPTWQSTARPATPPGFAPPPAPKRAHLAFGTRAAPPPSASLPGQTSIPCLIMPFLCIRAGAPAL
jgi:hypothetical protein